MSGRRSSGYLALYCIGTRGVVSSGRAEAEAEADKQYHGERTVCTHHRDGVHVSPPSVPYGSSGVSGCFRTGPLGERNARVER